MADRSTTADPNHDDLPPEHPGVALDAAPADDEASAAGADAPTDVEPGNDHLVTWSVPEPTGTSDGNEPLETYGPATDTPAHGPLILQDDDEAPVAETTEEPPTGEPPTEEPAAAESDDSGPDPFEVLTPRQSALSDDLTGRSVGRPAVGTAPPAQQYGPDGRPQTPQPLPPTPAKTGAPLQSIALGVAVVAAVAFAALWGLATGELDATRDQAAADMAAVTAGIADAGAADSDAVLALTDQLQTANDERDAAQDQVAALEAQVATIADLNVEIDALGTALIERNAQLDAANARIAELEAQIAGLLAPPLPAPS